MERKRILWCGEASFLATGYAVYAHEVLARLHETGKYDILELGSYGKQDDPRAASIPWKFVSVVPQDKEGQERHRQHKVLTFGCEKFEEVCLAHRAQICLDARDLWCMEHEQRSPFRRFFNWTIMPACDAEPQDEQWVASYMSADGVFTYSDWATSVLSKQSAGQIKLLGSAPPGANLEDFKPVANKKEHRRSMGVDPDCLIVGTVMRNQKRKLFPDLFKAFAHYLKVAPPEMAKKTFLYCHSSAPDIGWSLSRLMLETGVTHKCIFTYQCRDCGAVFPNFYSDVITTCKSCGKPTAQLANSNSGVSRKALAQILNLLDCYVQYSNSEGAGIPLMEAAACQVPVFGTDYSAMTDNVRKLKGYPIKVKNLVRESETHCWRASPDGEDFVEQLIKFFSLPQGMRERKGYESRKAVEQHYTYEKTAKLWETHLDSIEVRPESETWKSPPKFHQPNLNVPQGLSNSAFIEWGIHNILGDASLAKSHVGMRMTRDLSWGARLQNFGGSMAYFNDMSNTGVHQEFEEFSREKVVEVLCHMAQTNNHWERKRMEAIR
jgi:glycosyltransferase involved in cell wall biosynthesis